MADTKRESVIVKTERESGTGSGIRIERGVLSPAGMAMLRADSQGIKESALSATAEARLPAVAAVNAHE